MFRFTLLDSDDNELDVFADSRDVVQWERTSKEDERYTDLIYADRRSMTRFYRLAHIAATRQGLIDVKLKDFENEYALDVKSEDRKPNPTNAGASNEK